MAARSSWVLPSLSVRPRSSAPAVAMLAWAALIPGSALAVTAAAGPALTGVVAPSRPLRVEGLDSLAAATLGRALDYLGIKPVELGFDKLYADDDTFRLGLVEEILGDPLKLPGWQERTLEEIRAVHADLPGLAGRLGTIMEAPGQAAGERTRRANDRPGHPGSLARSKAAQGAERGEVASDGGSSAATPAADLDAAVATFIGDCAAAEAALDRAFAEFTPEDRTRILTLAPAFWGDGEDPGDKGRKGLLHFEAGVPVDTTLKWSEDPVLDAAVKLDRGSLTEASRLFLAALGRFETSLTALQPWAPGAGQPSPGAGALPPGATRTPERVTGTITAVRDTPWGLLIIGGTGPNDYAPGVLRGAAFIVDPGGDDVYRGRAASAAGGIFRPLAAIVDLGGNDFYDAEGRSFCLGGAVLGLAALIDRGGDDIYRGEDGSSGAAFFGGGFLFDGGGRDLFEGRNLCEGAGAFGIGALVSESPADPPPGPEPEVDLAYQQGLVKVPGTGSRPIRWDDNDTYLCARQSQGFASTFGIGLLFDRTGNDIYRSGGRYLHRPLLPNDFQSLSQGFSIGFRPRAGGGIGILCDEEGNDYYDAEVYAQGASYWYSLGLQYDGGGNDRYLATQYAQGAGIHLSVGSLHDRGGDDHYVCKLGVTQGTAHDLSVGMLLDDSGNDYYVVSDGQGMSITNSAAIFIDGLGDDTYATPGVGQGALTWNRGFCGPGIFLDLEGKDTYTGTFAKDGAVWSSDLYAIGIDLARNVVMPTEVIPPPVLTAADSARAVEELWETSCIWEVGSAREKVARARAALLTKGMPAVRYALQKGLDSQDGLVYRNLLEVGKSQPDSFTALIRPRLIDPNVWVQRNVISLLGEMKRKEARLDLEAMLRDPKQEKHCNRVIQALGNIGETAARPAIRPFLRDAKERRRIVSVVALQALKDTVSVPTLAAMLEDPTLTVRSAASAALVSFRAAAVTALVHATDSEVSWAHQGPAEMARLKVSAPDPASLAGAAPSQNVLRLRTLGRIGVSYADSTKGTGVEARGLVRRTLMAALDPPHADPAVRSAAVESLGKFGDAETLAFLRLRMRDETDPLVRRTWERARKEAGEKE
jgi:HEAT repeat protein